MTALLDPLKTALPPQAWTTDPDTIAGHLVEWRESWPGETPMLLTPATTGEVQTIVRLCAAAGVAITPQGGNTGLVGGQIPKGEVLLSLKRMNRIRSVEPVDDALTAEAGVTLVTVHEAAAAAGKRFALSLASEGSATIGGLISTNAGGVHVRRHGMMRALVLGLEAVLPDGSLLETLSSLRKDNTGYDLKQLLIGAEGTLGVVTAATLKLSPRPADVVTALLQVESAEAAVALLHRLEEATGALAVFEIMNARGMANVARHHPATRSPFPAPAPWTALVEFEGADAGVRAAAEAALAAALDDGLAHDVAIAQNAAQAKAFWALRELQSAAQRPEGLAVKHDVSVPVSRVPEFLRRAEVVTAEVCPGRRIVAFGHVSDGNIHYDVLQPDGWARDDYRPLMAPMARRVHDLVMSLGGSISAEHGVGVARREEFQAREPAGNLAAMRAIKRALDPQGIMNPRVLI